MPTRVTPPSMLDRAVSVDGACFEAIGDPTSLLKPAILHGVCLTYDMMAKIVRLNGWPLPDGTGRNDRVVVGDYARALVQRFFADLPEERQQELIRSLLGKRGSSMSNHCPKAVLAALKHMDPKDVDMPKEYVSLQKEVDELMMEKRRATQEHEIRMRMEEETQVTYTPRAIQPLLPGGGNLQHVYIRRHPILKRYQGSYPRLPAALNKRTHKQQSSFCLVLV